MLKKKKTTASGKLVLVKSVRRHWTSGGCPLSADRSGTETAQPQNEILCSRGLGGAAPGKQSGGEITAGFFPLRAECINTGIACPFCIFAWMYALLPAFRPLFFLDQLL